MPSHHLELSAGTVSYEDSGGDGPPLVLLHGLPRLPMTFGGMSARGIPDAVLDRWLEPSSTRPAIRRDLRTYAGDTERGRRELTAAIADSRTLIPIDRPAALAETLAVFVRDGR